MPLDPEAQAYLARTSPRPDTVAERREATRLQRVLHASDIAIPGPGGEIPLRVYVPAGQQPLPVLIYCHGGGWVTGDLDVNDTMCRILAEWAACIVVSVNYRHAPEHPFPAAFDDAYAATTWASREIAAFGGDPGRIAVSGASAGGNLAAAVALKARDEGMALAAQVLMYPVIDSGMAAASYEENAEGFGLTRAAMQWYWDVYVPDPEQRTNSYASPNRAVSLGGTAPGMVITAGYDPLRDEGDAYAAALQAAGVPVLHRCYEGMVHGFISNHGDFTQAKLCLIEIAAYLRERFGV